MPTTTKTAKTKSKAPVKKGTTKAESTNGASNGQAEYGVHRSHDLPWHDKKVAIFRAMKDLGANSKNPLDAKTIAEKANVTARDVRHYCYHAKAASLTGVREIEGARGYFFFLTAKGIKIDPVKAQKKEQESKSN